MKKNRNNRSMVERYSKGGNRVILEFKLYKLKETSVMYKVAVEDSNNPNEFIIVGEQLLSKDYDCYKVIQSIDNEDLKLISGLKLDEFGFLIKKDDLELTVDWGYESLELDIPKDYLTLDIIENIQRLNS